MSNYLVQSAAAFAGVAGGELDGVSDADTPMVMEIIGRLSL